MTALHDGEMTIRNVFILMEWMNEWTTATNNDDYTPHNNYLVILNPLPTKEAVEYGSHRVNEFTWIGLH